jgi:hypothetical protein
MALIFVFAILGACEFLSKFKDVFSNIYGIFRAKFPVETYALRNHCFSLQRALSPHEIANYVDAAIGEHAAFPPRRDASAGSNNTPNPCRPPRVPAMRCAIINKCIGKEQLRHNGSGNASCAARLRKSGKCTA